MAFNLYNWQQEYVTSSVDWKSRFAQSETRSVYCFLAGVAFFPVVKAVQGGDWSALAVLGALLGGSANTNILANLIQESKDLTEEEIVQLLEMRVSTTPELFAELDIMLEKLDAFKLAERTLNEIDRRWFAEAMQNEIIRGRFVGYSLEPGKIITFYSYKGGTGRTMALANVACLIAQRSMYKKGILMIDWDLEAPGLHRFFAPKNKTLSAKDEFDQLPGLIDFWLEFKSRLEIRLQKANSLSRSKVQEIIQEINIKKYIRQIDLKALVFSGKISNLFIMQAGQFDLEYPGKVSRFPWEDLFKLSPWVYKAFAEELAELFDFILIDSRTGITDTSGICTMMMPEKLVVVFTPNTQSLTGVSDLINRSINYRRASDDLRPLIVYPLPSRIEISETQQMEAWRSGREADGIYGYQKQFEQLFKDIYSLDNLNLDLYFNNVQITHSPSYSYGEKVAVLLEKNIDDRKSLGNSFRLFTNWLVDVDSPWNVSILPISYSASLLGDGAIAQGGGAVAVGSGGINVGGTYIKSGYSKDKRETNEKTLRSIYLNRLSRMCLSLPLAALGGSNSAENDVTLDKVYIDLNTIEVHETSKKKKKNGVQGIAKEKPKTALEAASEYRRLVLLGDPGAGKTTFVKNLLGWQASAILGKIPPPQGYDTSLIPVLVILRDLAPRLAGLDVEKLSSQRRDEQLAQTVWEQIQYDLGEDLADFSDGLQKTLQSGQCLLVLDGLDEVPHDLRGRVREAVDALLKIYTIQRIIVTCRVRSYVGDSMLPNFTSHTLAPFNKKQISNFVQAWYNTQRELGTINEAQAKYLMDDLSSAALETDLRELSSNPMLLTTMAIIHQREVGLPSKRVQLYHQAVEVLMRRWQKSKVGEVNLAGFLKNDLKLRQVMENLAYAANRASTKMKGSGMLLRKDALELLEQNENLGEVTLAAEFLDYVDQRAGLLVGYGGELNKPTSYSFPHRAFQEYLAGAYLAGRRDRVRTFYEHAAEGDSWDIAAQLAFEEIFYNRRGENELLDLAYQLDQPGASGAQNERARLWAGQIIAMVGREAVERDRHPNGGMLYLEKLISRLVASQNSKYLTSSELIEVKRVLEIIKSPS